MNKQKGISSGIEPQMKKAAQSLEELMEKYKDLNRQWISKVSEEMARNNDQYFGGGINEEMLANAVAEGVAMAFYRMNPTPKMAY